jgi:hypothetical protein
MKNRAITLFVILNFLGAITFWHMSFSYFAEQDDEGFLMASVLAWLSGVRSYEEYFTRYGLFYYFQRLALHQLLSLPLSNSLVRLVSVCSGLLTINLLTLAAHSRLVGLQIGRLGFSTLYYLLFFILVSHYSISEPGHPQELLMILLSCMVFFLLAKENLVPAHIFILGILAGLLLFTKINSGLFIALSVVLALLSASQRQGVNRFLWCALWIVTFSLSPILLYPSLGSLEGAVLLSLLTLSLIPICHQTTIRNFTQISERSLPMFSFGFSLVFSFFFFWYLVSVGGLDTFFAGVLFQHLSLPGQYSVPLGLGIDALLLGVSSLTLYFYVYLGNRKYLDGLRFAYFSILVLFALLERNAGIISFGLAFSWLPLISTSGGGLSPVRLILVLMSVLHTLYCYPVAGGQAAIVSSLFILNTSFSLADMKPWRTMLVPNFIGVSALILFYLGGSVWIDRYQKLQPLHLSGTEKMRLTKYQNLLYGSLSQVLQENNQPFATFPGMNSFYFWTESTPPSWMNGAWGNLFNAKFQEEVIAVFETSSSPIVLENQAINRFWSGELMKQSPPIFGWLDLKLPRQFRISDFVVHSKAATTSLGSAWHSKEEIHLRIGGSLLRACAEIRLLEVFAPPRGSDSFFRSEIGWQKELERWERNGNWKIPGPSDHSPQIIALHRVQLNPVSRSFFALELVDKDRKVIRTIPIFRESSSLGTRKPSA